MKTLTDFKNIYQLTAAQKFPNTVIFTLNNVTYIIYKEAVRVSGIGMAFPMKTIRRSTEYPHPIYRFKSIPVYIDATIVDNKDVFSIKHADTHDIIIEGYYENDNPILEFYLSKVDRLK